MKSARARATVGTVIFGISGASAAPVRPEPMAISVPRTGAAAAAVSSHLIYLHRCEAAGCVVYQGAVDDSRTATSSLADGNRSISGFTQPDAVWQAMVQCVKDTYAAFDVTVTDVDPGNVPHFEELVGGTPDELRGDIPNAGGVAPFNCDEVANGISFTFDVFGPDPLSLCWTVAQETAHTFGLEHEYLVSDPMTYIPGDLPKRFQWQDAPCGTNTPAACRCSTGGTQSSYRHLYTLFGVGRSTPPTVAIAAPADGKTVTPRFPIRVDATDDAAIARLELWIDGAMADALTAAPWRFTAPPLAEGGHGLEIRATDTTEMTATTAIHVIQGPPCTARGGCDGTDVCVAGGCIPGPDAAGGLGATCRSADQCLSLQCASAGDAFAHCVAPCDPAMPGSCPDSFACLASGSGGVCWPSADGGCCSAGDSRGSLVSAAWGALFVGGSLRRRRPDRPGRR